MIVYLNKDRFGLRYRTYTNSGWMYLPDKAQTLEGAKNFFTEEGRYKEPGFIITDNFGKPVTHYFIKERGAVINFDPTDRIILPEDYFFPYEEQIKYLQQFSERETDQDGKKITSEYQRLQHFKKNAGEGELNGLKDLLQEKMSKDKIVEFCQEHSKKFYSNEAQVEFPGNII